MNVLKIALFVFLIQEAIVLVAAANIPISCTSDGSSCLYFTTDTIAGTTWAEVIAGEVDEGQYKTTQIETDIDADLWTATATALNIFISILWGSIAGIYSLIIFFFGWSAISIAIATVLQAIVYYFYSIMFAKVIKNVRGDI